MRRMILALVAVLAALVAAPLAVRPASAAPAQIGALATTTAPLVHEAQYYRDRGYRRGYRPYRPSYGRRRFYGPGFYGRPRYYGRRHYGRRYRY